MIYLFSYNYVFFQIIKANITTTVKTISMYILHELYDKSHNKYK